MRSFDMMPASSPAFFISNAAVILVLVLLIAFFAFVIYTARNAKFEVSDEGLRIRGGIYGRFVPRTDIVGQGVKIMNLGTEKDYRPALRTNGIGLPGYAAGWFKLKNKEKALLFVTDQSSVVYIPTTQGYAIMLSVSNATDFYNSLRQWR